MLQRPAAAELGRSATGRQAKHARVHLMLAAYLYICDGSGVCKNTRILEAKQSTHAGGTELIFRRIRQPASVDHEIILRGAST